MTEKIILCLCLFAGFFWIRSRARKVELENQKGKALLGVYLLLPVMLIAEKYAFDRLDLEPVAGTAAQAGALLATFALVGYAFLRPGVAAPGPQQDTEAKAPAPRASAQP